jgi:hypothetical protein
MDRSIRIPTKYLRLEWRAVVVLGALCASTALAAADPSLMGCWRNIDSLSYSADGHATRARLPCTLEVSRYRMISVCVRPSGEQRVDYAYQVLRPGVYEDTILAHSALPSAFFTKSESAYSIVGDLLFTSVYPQGAGPFQSGKAGRIDTVSVRAAAPWRCGS